MTRPEPSKDGSAPDPTPDPAPALSPPDAYAFVNSLPEPAPGRHVLPVDPSNWAPEVAFMVPSSATPDAPARARIWALNSFLSPCAREHLGKYLGTLALWRTPGESGAVPAEILVEDDARAAEPGLRELAASRRTFGAEYGASTLVVELTLAGAQPRVGTGHWVSY